MTDTQAQPATPAQLPADAIDAARVPNQVRPSDVLIVGARITDDVIERVCTVEQALVDAALAAALPFLERTLRAKIAAEVEAYPDAPATSSERFKVGFHEMRAVAARIARGEEATE